MNVNLWCIVSDRTVAVSPQRELISQSNQESGSVKLKLEYSILSCDTHFIGNGCNFCEENYHTPSCDEFCEPSENYTCDHNTGVHTYRTSHTLNV